MARATDGWLCIAAGDDRMYGGNDGYADDPSTRYEWTDRVGNYAGPSVGDLIAIWDKETLLGASVIEEIETWVGDYLVRSCPRCGMAKLRTRRQGPRYRCGDCHHETDSPTATAESVTFYATRHDAGWVTPGTPIGRQELIQHVIKQDGSPSPMSQLAIRRLRLSSFEPLLKGRLPEGSSRLITARREAAAGHATRQVRVRRGQQRFRRDLLDRFGAVCAMTGACPEEALEAAHLYSYAELGEHRNDGGLLMRADLHGLFDAGLIAVSPEDQTIDLVPQLRSFSHYAHLHGARLQAPVADGQQRWLATHWKEHRLDR